MYSPIKQLYIRACFLIQLQKHANQPIDMFKLLKSDLMTLYWEVLQFSFWWCGCIYGITLMPKFWIKGNKLDNPRTQFHFLGQICTIGPQFGLKALNWRLQVNIIWNETNNRIQVIYIQRANFKPHVTILWT